MDARQHAVGGGGAPRTALFDLFLDLAHPAASSSSSSDPYRAVKPPVDDPESVAVADELLEPNSLRNIVRFAFPNFSDRVHEVQPPPSPHPASAGLNSHDVYAHSFRHHHFEFSTRCSRGTVRGHVRTYLPPRTDAASRVDVGRRGPRALVLLTRTEGRGRLFAAVLRTVEAASLRAAARRDDPDAARRLLSALHRAGAGGGGEAVVAAGEFGPDARLAPSDAHRFDLAPERTPAEILPLVRCVGPATTCRLLCALLCERRVVLLSYSPSRLSRCAAAAAALPEAAFGTRWRHPVVPVLPPHQFGALASRDRPYVVGIVTDCARATGVTGMAGVEDVVCVVLDQESNNVRLFGRGKGTELDKVVPDLLAPNPTDISQYVSIGEVLVQDLSEVLKNDRNRYTSNLAAAVQNIAKKSGAAAKNMVSSIGKLANSVKEKGRNRLQTLNNNLNNNSSSTQPPPLPETPAAPAPPPPAPSLHNSPDDARVLGSNLIGEEDLRVALVSFALSLVGSGSWYLARGHDGTLVVDRDRFIEERRRRGDVPGSPAHDLVVRFARSSVFHDHADARRVECASGGARLTAASPLSDKCLEYHARHAVPFDPFDVRRVARQVGQLDPRRREIAGLERARQLTLALTSNQRFEGDAAAAVARLVGATRVANTHLVDFLDVVRTRLRNAESQWRPALQALHLLRNALLRGPSTVAAEAAAGSALAEEVRALRTFDRANRANSTQVREAARAVYALTVDPTKLFAQRRAVAARVATTGTPRARLLREKKLRPSVPFFKMHRFLHAKVYPNDAGHADTGNLLDINDDAHPNNNNTTNDLLSFAASAAPPPTSAGGGPTDADFFAALLPRPPKTEPNDPFDNNNNAVNKLTDALDNLSATARTTTTTTSADVFSNDPFRLDDGPSTPALRGGSVVVPQSPADAARSGPSPYSRPPPQQPSYPSAHHPTVAPHYPGNHAAMPPPHPVGANAAPPPNNSQPMGRAPYGQPTLPPQRPPSYAPVPDQFANLVRPTTTTSAPQYPPNAYGQAPPPYHHHNNTSNHHTTKPNQVPSSGFRRPFRPPARTNARRQEQLYQQQFQQAQGGASGGGGGRSRSSSSYPNVPQFTPR